MNIDAHITDVQRPQSTRRSALRGTTVISKELPVNNGIEAVRVFGANIAPRTSNIPKPEVHSISIFEDTLSAMKPATKRPMSIRSQYVPATKPPMAAAFSSIPAPFSDVSEI